MFTCLIGIDTANYYVSGAQIYYELSVGTKLSTCDHRLTCINISLASCLLAPDKIQKLVVISVDAQLQYFMPYSISVNLNFILLPQCCSLFWHYKRKWLLWLHLVYRGCQHSLCIWGRKLLNCSDSGKVSQTKLFSWYTWFHSRTPNLHSHTSLSSTLSLSLSLSLPLLNVSSASVATATKI
jgi:hypothetical protein